MANDTYEVVTLEASGANDVAFSPDQTTLYVAKDDGNIHVIDVATQQILATWDVGYSLGAVSVSQDGTYLLVTERSPGGGSPFAGPAVVYKVNTSSAAVQTFSASGLAFYDVEITDTQTAILTGQAFNAIRMDLSTGLFSPISQSVNYNGYSTVMVEDGRYTLMAEPVTSNGPLFLYDDLLGTIVSSSTLGGDMSGFNWGTQAISEEAGLILQFSHGGSFQVYNLSLVYQYTINVGDIYTDFDGSAFSNDGTSFYCYDIDLGKVFKLSVHDWTVVDEFAVGTSNWHNDVGFGSQILVSDSGRYISVMDTQASSGKLQLIDLTGRDESLRVGSSTSEMVGGGGIDTLVVDFSSATTAVSMRNHLDLPGVPTVDPMGGYTGTLTDGGSNHVEFTTIEIFDITSGNGNDDLRTGDGNDRLNGGTGADAMLGGIGNDTYVVDDLGDTVVELAGEGTDELQTTLGIGSTLQERRAAMYQLTSANVEILTGTSDLGQGLRGNSGDNIINAANGDDYIDLTDGGTDEVNSGDGRDVLYYGSALDGSDANDAGYEGGDTRGDLLVIQGNYSAELILGSDALVDVEKLRVLKADNTSFGHDGTGQFDYFLHTDDANVAAGSLLVVQGGSLQAGETLIFNGSDETDGRFQIFGGRDADQLFGGSGDDHLLGRAGDDLLIGNGGIDRLRGGLGRDIFVGGGDADTYVYAPLPNAPDNPYTVAALESTGLNHDVFGDFNFAEDKIDLPQAVASLAEVLTGALSSASFDADLAAAIDGALQANGAVLFTADAGDRATETFLVIDADGNGAYQANLDFVMELENSVGAVPATPDFFI